VRGRGRGRGRIPIHRPVHRRERVRWAKLTTCASRMLPQLPLLVFLLLQLLHVEPLLLSKLEQQRTRGGYSGMRTFIGRPLQGQRQQQQKQQQQRVSR
jgi:hypothetical protein